MDAPDSLHAKARGAAVLAEQEALEAQQGADAAAQEEAHARKAFMDVCRAGISAALNGEAELALGPAKSLVPELPEQRKVRKLRLC